MFENIDRKELEYNITIKSQREYNFPRTRYESASMEQLITEFYAENFNRLDIQEQRNLIQERVNRLIRNASLENELYVEITSNTEKDVDIVGDKIKVHPYAFYNPVLLYAELAGVIERQRQFEYAEKNPTTALGLQVNGAIVNLSTGYSYDREYMEQKSGFGTFSFQPTMSTNLSMQVQRVTQRINEYAGKIRERDKNNPMYYISRLSPAEKFVAKVLEREMEEVKAQMMKDGVTNERMNYYNDAMCIIGSYEEDKQEYSTRIRANDPDTDIATFIEYTGNGNDARSTIDVFDTDIKLAAIHTYLMSMGMKIRTEDDPRLLINRSGMINEIRNTTEKEFNKFFYPKMWESFSFEAKKIIMQEHCKREAEKLGLTKQYNIVFENMHDGKDGYYNNANTIFINKKAMCICNPMILYTLVSHELMHARQREIAEGLIYASDKERMFNMYYASPIRNVTTPNKYHNQTITPINAENIRYKISAFRFMDSAVASQFNGSRVREAINLYRLQPIEREAYEYQEKRLIDLEKQMEADGALDEKTKRELDFQKKYFISETEKEVIEKYGCLDPTEAIRQFQSFVCDLERDYDPQTSDFDFAMRFQMLSVSTYHEYRIYPDDPREKIDAEEKQNVSLQTDEKILPWKTPGIVEGRMSKESQMYPARYLKPLSDIVYTDDFDLDIVKVKNLSGVPKSNIASGIVEVEDITEVVEEGREDDMLSEEDAQYILDALDGNYGEQNMDIMDVNEGEQEDGWEEERGMEYDEEEMEAE